jgi:5-methylcytosine-specific restriction enzyme A
MVWREGSNNRPVPYRLQKACFRRDEWTCVGCGFVGEPNAGQLQADHIIPRAEGGVDTLENLATLCVSCHGIKTQQEAARGRQRRSGKRRPPLHPADALSGPPL